MIKRQNTVICVAHKRLKLKDAATGCVLRPVDASKCVCGRAPLGELRALPQVPYLDLGRWRNGEGSMETARGKGMEGTEREKRGNGISGESLGHWL